MRACVCVCVLQVLKDALRKHRHEVDALRCLAEQHRKSTISDPADFVSIRSCSLNSTNSSNSRDSGNMNILDMPVRGLSPAGLISIAQSPVSCLAL